MLTLKRRLNDGSFIHNVVRKDETHKKLVAGHIGRRWSVNVSNTNGIETELGSQTLSDNATCCASVNHRHRREGRRNRGASCLQGGLDGFSNRDPEFYHRTDSLQVRDLRGEGGHVRRREDSR